MPSSPWATSGAPTSAPATSVPIGSQGGVDKANNLARQSGNLIKNGNSEDPNPTGCEAEAVATIPAFAGSKARVAYGVSYPIVTGNISCAPGEEFRFEAMVRTTGSHTAFLRMRFLDSAGQHIPDDRSTASLTSLEWVRQSVSGVAPAGACYVFFFLVGSGPSDTYAAFDCLYAERTQNGVVQINSVDYLTNADKIKLRADWDAEQETRSKLNATADALGVSRVAYENSVIALFTNVQAATGVGNWDVAFPDGSTSGPLTSIMLNLRTWWTSVALHRAALQKAITDKIQANVAYSDALARSSHNLVKNGNSENANPTGWEADGLSTDRPYSGTRRRGRGFYTGLIPCAPGDQFYVEAMGAVDSGLGIYYSEIADSSGAGFHWIGTTFTNTSYQKVSFTATVPAGGAFIRFYSDSTAPGFRLDNLYACRKVSAGMLEADAIQTSNYTQNPSGVPITGVRMDISATALKAAAGNLQLGPYIFSDYFWRQLQAIDGANGGRVLYRGNVDVTSRGGAPNIACLSVTRRRWDTTLKMTRLELTIQPSISGSSDNLDAIRFAKVQLYRQSAAGTTATLTAIDTFFPALADRRYGNFGTDTDANNASLFTFEAQDSLIASGVPAVLITLFNAYGPSAGNCFYSASGAANDVPLANNGTTWPTGITGAAGGGSGGGGGGGGGGCPAPWALITLASGLVVEAADLYDGAVVVGVDDVTMSPSTGIVRHPMTIWVERVAIHLEGGGSTEFSANHRLAVEGRGWVEVRHLRPGDSLIAQTPSIVKAIGRPTRAQVVSFQVEGCATYFADGILSHNVKILDPD